MTLCLAASKMNVGYCYCMKCEVEFNVFSNCWFDLSFIFLTKTSFILIKIMTNLSDPETILNFVNIHCFFCFKFSFSFLEISFNFSDTAIVGKANTKSSNTRLSI